MDVLNTFLKAVHGGFDVQNNIEPNMWEELVRLLNEAAVQGLSQGDFAIEHNKEFLRALKHSNEVFAAFKTHVMGISMADKLLDENGNLKPFDKWVKDVSSISRHQVGSWLKTEYNTAVLRAHNAADWQEFVANKDILPNLRWMPTTSPDAEATHRTYWEKKLTLPVDHPFWVKHHPGDRWNCKCALEATDEPATPEGVLDKIPDTQPHRGLENNPGMDGVLIGDSHPYFPTNCRQCAFYKPSLENKIKHFFLNAKKDCMNCRFIDKKIENTTKDKGITADLAELQSLQGADYIRKIKTITQRKEFKEITKGIYSVGGETQEDYLPLMKAAQKAVSHGYKVFILPNPNKIRTPDFIFERKGVYKVYDLKTISGEGSAGSRMMESIGQTNRVLLNMNTTYKPRKLALDIKKYFETNAEGLEVLIFKGKREILIIRESISKDFIHSFIRNYE